MDDRKYQAPGPDSKSSVHIAGKWVAYIPKGTILAIAKDRIYSLGTHEVQ